MLNKFGEVIVAPPDTKLHVPVPTAGLFPFKVAVVAHTVWFAPATDVLGLRSRCTETVELEFGQLPLPIVHCNTFIPAPNAVKPVLNKFGEVIVAIPDTKLQVPVPTAGLFPFKVANVAHTV